MAKTRAVGGVLMLASLAWPARAAELTARGPRECADSAELSFRVERSIGMPLGRAAPLAFDVTMERAAAEYVAHIVVEGAEPEATRFARDLRAPDCGKLVDAVSVSVALALGMAEQSPDATAANSADRLDANASAATATASDAASDPASAAPPAAGADDATSSPETSPALAPSISLWLLGDAGSLPSPSLGAALGVELGWPQLELRALGTLLFEQDEQLDSLGTPAPGAKLQLATGGVLACAAPFGDLRASLAAFACLGAEIGQLSGVGTRVASPRRGGTLWAAPLMQAGLGWRVPHTALRLALALIGAAPLTRDEFALRDIGTVHQPPSVIGRLSIGVSVGFN